MIKDYTSGNIVRQLLTFAWPFMLSNLLQTAYNLVDMVVVGHYCGDVGLAGVSTGTDLVHFFTFFGFGLTMAGQILVSQYVGIGDKEGLKRMIGTLFTCVAAVALALTAVGLCFGDVFLSWLNVPPEAMADAHDYAYTCFVGVIFTFGYLAVSCVLRGMGDSKRPFVFIAVAAVTNTVLDVIFVSSGMGPFGAALATIIAQAVSLVTSLTYLARRREQFGFDFKLRSFIPGGRQMKMLVAQGIPMIVQNSVINFSSLFVASYINVYGVTAVAVTGIGNKLTTIAMIVTVALNTAGASIVGQNFAAGRMDRVRSVVWYVAFIGGGVTLLLAVLILIFPEQAFAIFNTDPDVLALSHSYAIIAAINFMGFAVRTPVFVLINGIAFAKMNLFIGLVDGIVMRIGLALLLGVVLEMGLRGFWLGGALAGLTPFILIFPYFLSGAWTKRRPPVAE